MPSDGEGPPSRTPRVPRQQQDQAPLPAEPAISPLLGRGREPLGEDASHQRGPAPHRQEGSRRRARRDARARRERLKRGRPCAKRSSSNPPPAPATSTPPPRTS